MTEKLKNLRSIIVRHEKIIVLFSGGVDSTFLLKMCIDCVGRERVLALTATSESYTPEELEKAERIAAGWRVEHLVVKTAELSDPVFASNPPDRCYHCKRELFGRALAIAEERGGAAVFVGANRDDLSDYRPGHRAAAELGIISPLLEAGLGKEEIRSHSRELGLPTWNAAPNPCLASRIPYGSEITVEKLETVGEAEAFIRSLGFSEIRVRHHGDIARIETLPRDIACLCEPANRQAICRHLKSLGFTWVALDLEGYRQGSLNETLDKGLEQS